MLIREPLSELQVVPTKASPRPSLDLDPVRKTKASTSLPDSLAMFARSLPKMVPQSVTGHQSRPLACSIVSVHSIVVSRLSFSEYISSTMAMTALTLVAAPLPNSL